MTQNADLFLESILNSNHKVYGFNLKPLSLFHLSLLEKFCPDVLGQCDDPQELQKAAAICSIKYPDQFNNIGNSWKAYFAPLYAFTKERIKFQSYLSDFMTLPETLDTPEMERNNPFPFALAFTGKLIKETGYSFDYVFYELNIAQVFWLISVMTYMETGETGVISDKEKQIYSLINDKMK